MDQVCALNVRYREVRSIPLKYVRNFIFDPFLRFLLDCVPENPCPDISGVPITECLICRGTTVAGKEEESAVEKHNNQEDLTSLPRPFSALKNNLCRPIVTWLSIPSLQAPDDGKEGHRRC